MKRAILILCLFIGVTAQAQLKRSQGGSRPVIVTDTTGLDKSIGTFYYLTTDDSYYRGNGSNLVSISGGAAGGSTETVTYADNSILTGLSGVAGYGYFERQTDTFMLGDSVFSSLYQYDEIWDNLEQVNSDTMLVYMSDSLAFFDISDASSMVRAEQVEVGDFPEQLGVTMMEDSRLAVIAKVINNKVHLVMYDTQNPASMTDWGSEDSLAFGYDTAYDNQSSFLYDVGDYLVFLGRKTTEFDDSLRAYTIEVNQETKEIVGLVDSCDVNDWRNYNPYHVQAFQFSQKDYFGTHIDSNFDNNNNVVLFKVDSTNGSIAKTDTLFPYSEDHYTCEPAFTSRGNKLACVFKPNDGNDIISASYIIENGLVADTISIDTFDVDISAIMSANFYGENKVAVEARDSFDARMYLLQYADMADPIIGDSSFIEASYSLSDSRSPAMPTADSTKLFMCHIQDHWDHEYRIAELEDGNTTATQDLEGNSLTIHGTSTMQDIVPDSDGTRDLGTQTTGQWANVWADLVNGSDYAFLNDFRLLEAEKYSGYPEGLAIGCTHFETGVVTEEMPDNAKPVFVITREFLEYKGVRFTKEELERLKELLE